MSEQDKMEYIVNFLTSLRTILKDIPDTGWGFSAGGSFASLIVPWAGPLSREYAFELSTKQIGKNLSILSFLKDAKDTINKLCDISEFLVRMLDTTEKILADMTQESKAFKEGQLKALQELADFCELNFAAEYGSVENVPEFEGSWIEQSILDHVRLLNMELVHRIGCLEIETGMKAVGGSQ